ncbi:RNA-directed DNA polymerase, eukaryota [Tanacetum coccineum]|uniref:RNA-directed DNA polymerase, eukaryota n=1 Tax=Tanacetum coccineum TaxID=301880 RepID=A0ABQ5ETK4_9ASTR
MELATATRRTKSEQWDDLSSILNSGVLSSSKDRWTCDLSGDGEFKVKVIRNFINDLFLPSSDVETRWVKFIPIKVNVFSWRAHRDRLPTKVNLNRRGILLDSHLCPLCNAAMEDVQHVFFRCDVARVVLRKICRWWDLDWQEICVAWWRIWRLRNQLVFDASPPNRSTIFDDIKLQKVKDQQKRAATNKKVTTTEIWDEYKVIKMSGDSDFDEQKKGHRISRKVEIRGAPHQLKKTNMRCSAFSSIESNDYAIFLNTLGSGQNGLWLHVSRPLENAYAKQIFEIQNSIEEIAFHHDIFQCKPFQQLCTVLNLILMCR